jgi:hypothetical protein
MMTKDHFTNYDLAAQYVTGMADAQARVFVSFGFATAVTGRRMPPDAEPESPCDLLHLCKVLEAMYANKALIGEILQGRHSEWEWPE